MGSGNSLISSCKERKCGRTRFPHDLDHNQCWLWSMSRILAEGLRILYIFCTKNSRKSSFSRTAGLHIEYQTKKAKIMYRCNESLIFHSWSLLHILSKGPNDVFLKLADIFELCRLSLKNNNFVLKTKVFSSFSLKGFCSIIWAAEASLFKILAQVHRMTLFCFAVWPWRLRWRTIFWPTWTGMIWLPGQERVLLPQKDISYPSQLEHRSLPFCAQWNVFEDRVIAS